MAKRRSKISAGPTEQTDSTSDLLSVFADAIERSKSRPLTCTEKLRAARLRQLAHEAVEDLMYGIFNAAPKVARGEIKLLRRAARLLLGVTKAGEICFAIAGYIEVIGAELERDSKLPWERHLHWHLRRVAPLIDHFWHLLHQPLPGERGKPLDLLRRAVRLKSKRNKRWLAETHMAMTAIGIYKGGAASFEKGFYRCKSKPIGPRNMAD